MRALVLSFVLLAVAGTPVRAAEPVSQTFAAPADRVWAVTESILKSRGWDVDKVDRTVGWITTDSRGVEGENYGVYAKGTRHRLRIIIKPVETTKTAVTVERTVFKRERILFVDKDEPLNDPSQTVEKALLADIGRAL